MKCDKIELIQINVTTATHKYDFAVILLIIWAKRSVKRYKRKMEIQHEESILQQTITDPKVIIFIEIIEYILVNVKDVLESKT